MAPGGALRWPPRVLTIASVRLASGPYRVSKACVGRVSYGAGASGSRVSLWSTEEATVQVVLAGISGRRMLAALIKGACPPQKLVALVFGSSPSYVWGRRWGRRWNKGGRPRRSIVAVPILPFSPALLPVGSLLVLRLGRSSISAICRGSQCRRLNIITAMEYTQAPQAYEH
jgi:hypothetical protein